MYNNPNLGLLKESGMWDWVDIWNLLVLVAEWQFMYLQAGHFPLAAGADAAVDVQPHPVPVLGAVQQWAVLTWCRAQCYLGGCNHGSLSLQKPTGSSSPPFDQIPLCDVQREELHRACCLQVLGSSATKEEQEVIPTNICPIPGTWNFGVNRA